MMYLRRPTWSLFVDLKNIHNLQVESYVLSSVNFEDFKSWDSTSSHPERTALEEAWGGARLCRSFATKGG